MRYRMGAIRTAIFTASVAVLVAASPALWAALEGVVFAVSTDKAVYYYTEPIHVEVLWTNPSGDQINRITSAGTYQYAAISVIDMGTNSVVFSTPVTALSSTLPEHTQEIFGIAEIPAYKLASGNKKYRIILSTVQKLQRYGDPTINNIYTNASRVITVR